MMGTCGVYKRRKSRNISMTLKENDIGEISYSVRFSVSEVMLVYGECNHMLYKQGPGGSVEWKFTLT